VETALDSLMAQLGTTATDVNNVTNQFLCLSNTQFLENRVYDDDDDDNNNGDDKEMLPEQKKEEAKVRAVMTASQFVESVWG
jgi:WASH complex subunit FAM21